MHISRARRGARIPHVPTTALAFVALALAAAEAARAQDAPDHPAATTTALPPVVVEAQREGAMDQVQGYVARRATTGTKTDTPIREIPQSVSVVTRDQIDARQAQTLGQALRYSAGVRVEQYGADWRFDWFRLRGFDAQTNSVYLDGLRYQFGSLVGMIEPYGLQRIEILRGPSSVLYGPNEPGGVVNLVQRRPTPAPQGEVRLLAGSHANRTAAFTSSGPLDRDGTWSYSLTGFGRLANTQVDYTPNDRGFVAPALTWRPDEDTSLTLLAYYQRDWTNGTQFLPSFGTVFATPFGRVPTSRFTGEPDYDKFARTQYGLGYAFERRLGSTFTVRQNLRYAHAGYDWQQLYGLGVRPDLRTLDRFAFRSDTNANAFQVDTGLQARFATGPLDHTVLVGLDYARGVFDTRIAGAGAAPIDLYAPAYGAPLPAYLPFTDSRQTSDQVGLYLQDQIRLGERWVMTVGGRQDWVNTDTRNRLATTTERQDDSAFTWRAGLVYLAGSGLAPYASYARSFQPQLGTNFLGQPFRPSKGEQFEIGIKYQPPGLNSFIQASLFQITQTNLRTVDPANPLNQVQTGEVRIRGFELEGVASLANGLSLIGSYTYLDPETTQSNTPGEVGRRPSGIPNHAAALWLDYTIPESAGRFAGIGIGGGVRYVGNTPAGNANAFLVPSATLFDLALRYDLERLGRNLKGMQLAVNATNLTDEQYVGRCDGASSCFYGFRRSVVGSVAYRW